MFQSLKLMFTVFELMFITFELMFQGLGQKILGDGESFLGRGKHFLWEGKSNFPARDETKHREGGKRGWFCNGFSGDFRRIFGGRKFSLTFVCKCGKKVVPLQAKLRKTNGRNRKEPAGIQCLEHTGAGGTGSGAQKARYVHR